MCGSTWTDEGSKTLYVTGFTASASMPISFDDVQVEPGYQFTLSSPIIDDSSEETGDTAKLAYHELTTKLKYRIHDANNGLSVNPYSGFGLGFDTTERQNSYLYAFLTYIIGIEFVFSNHLIIGTSFSDVIFSPIGEGSGFITYNTTRLSFTTGWLF